MLLQYYHRCNHWNDDNRSKMIMTESWWGLLCQCGWNDEKLIGELMKKCYWLSVEITFDRSYKVPHCNCHHNMVMAMMRVMVMRLMVAMMMVMKMTVLILIVPVLTIIVTILITLIVKILNGILSTVLATRQGLTQAANTLLHCQWFILALGIYIYVALLGIYV